MDAGDSMGVESGTVFAQFITKADDVVEGYVLFLIRDDLSMLTAEAEDDSERRVAMACIVDTGK
jgi:hypothetical protein